jgi:protein SCO1
MVRPSLKRRVAGAPCARLAVALLVLPVLLSGCASGGDDSGAKNPAGAVLRGRGDGQAPSGWRGTPILGVFHRPHLMFTDTSGQPFNFARDPDTPATLVFFGYTHCPDVCNTVLAAVASALRRSPGHVRNDLRLVFVTTDPQRDSLSVMHDYLKRFDPSFVGLTASLATIKKAANDLGVAMTGTSRLPGGGYDVGHGAQVIGFSSDGRSQVMWTPQTPIADLRHDFAKIVAIST